MTVSQAIETVRQAGGEFLVPEPGKLQACVPSPRPAGLETALTTIREHRDEALVLITAPGPSPEPRTETDDPEQPHGAPWPPECLAAERKFGVPSARLYPLLDHVVLTPEGAGVLLQVFKQYVRVHFDGEHKTRQFRPEQIAIPAD